tara:strand:- start:6870 stop:7499 length:630 start_codon:yes stop_codon:yes gene_type:complete
VEGDDDPLNLGFCSTHCVGVGVQPYGGPTQAYTVDLKWSIWTTDENEFVGTGTTTSQRRYRIDLGEKMRNAFLGTGPPIEIQSAPRKEIRYGNVTIKKGGAVGEMRTCWGEVYELVPDDMESIDEATGGGVTDAISDWVDGRSGFDEGGDVIGAFVDFDIKASTFEAMMEAIDQQEEMLIQQDMRNSKELSAERWMRPSIRWMPPKKIE